MAKLKSRVGLWLALAVFLFLLIWYRNIHPFVMLTFDDWRFIARTRAAIPWPRAWNPTRLLPETLMPLCGYIAAYVVYPFTGDYIGALTDVFALTASLFVTAYVYTFYRAIRKLFDLEAWLSAVLSILFLGLHFLILRGKNTGNPYLLGGDEPNLLFFYTIPALLNAMMVMVFEIRCGEESESPMKRAMLILACYFAICSNMYCSIILSAYAAMRLGLDWWQKRNVRQVLKQNRGFALLIGGWLVSIAIEFFGGRSRKLREIRHSKALLRSGYYYLKSLGRMNIVFLLLTLATLAVCLVLLRRRRGKRDRRDDGLGRCIRLFAACFCLVSVYSVLLASIVSPGDMREAKLWVVLAFYMLLGVCAGIGYLASRFPKPAIALPLCVVVLLSFAVPSGGMVFTDGTPKDIRASVCKQIEDELVARVSEADRAGLDAVTVEVPQTDLEKNVPIKVTMSKYVAQALYRHGITSKLMDITLHPNPEINASLFLDETLH